MNSLLITCLMSLWAYEHPPVQEVNGFVEVEAENYLEQTKNQKRSWEKFSLQTADNHAQAAGKNSYIKCLPDTRKTHDDKLIKEENFTDKAGEMAVLSYTINFTTTGRFYVWVRAYSTGSEDNGIHLGFDNQWIESGKRMQWCDGKNKWTWASKQRTTENHCGEPYKIYIDVPTTGEHTIQFSMREDGFEFDKFLLTTDKTFDPNITLKRAQIYIRDPFFYPDTATKTYYMYSSAYRSDYLPDAVNGVVVYQSQDLENWSKPAYVFKTPPNWWASAQHGVWAPEVHRYRGKYYLFATFTNPDKPLPKRVVGSSAKAVVRGTSILVSDQPTGPFKPLSDKAMTPPDWMALDGTLFVEGGKPYLVFCHEWVQIVDGTMNMVRLKKDLSGPIGKPRTLFRASEADWVRRTEVKAYQSEGNITDGPWFYRAKTGKLLMLWSSFGKDGYAVGVSESKTGKLAGPWVQQRRLFDKNGGHAMLFQTFNGRLMLTVHQPNSGDIRAQLFEVTDTGHTLRLTNSSH
jgi:GH43 family beta-xylosidase